MARKFNKSKNNSKGRKNCYPTNNNGSRNESRDDYASKSNDPSKHLNDWSWYAQNEQILKDTASLSYNTALGAPMTVGSPKYMGSTDRAGIPGILQLYFMPTIGPTIGTQITSVNGIDVAANKIYTYVRHQNSGHSNYDAPDLMMYLLAMDSIYMWINKAIRAYGIARHYEYKNRYLPDAMLRASGFDPSIKADLCNFRGLINLYVQQINKLCVPSVMPYFLRHSYLTSNVFKDADSDKAQCYIFDTGFWYQFVEKTDTGRGYLKATHLHPTEIRNTLTIPQFKVIMDTMINAVVQSEDFNIMSGDVMKAYGNNLFQISLMPEDYEVAPVYVPEILDQIHNATLCSTPLGNGNGEDSRHNIFQTEDGLLRQYNDIQFKYGNFATKLLDFDKSVVEPKDTLVATRLTVMNTDGIFADGKFIPNDITFGSEVLYGAFIYSNDYDDTEGVWTQSAYQIPNELSLTDINVGNYMQYTKFRKAPFIPVYSGVIGEKGDLAAVSFHTYAGEVDNYTVLTRDTLAMMHEGALLNEFGVVL